MQFLESQLLLVILYQFPPINLPKTKSSLLFCTGYGGHQKEDLSICRVSRTHTIKITENSRANGTNPTARITIKSKAETPAHCDTQVIKIVGDIKISNKKFKAGNIASCLSKWKEITSDKWVLSTISSANIEFEDITQIPLAQRKPQKHERDSHLYRYEIENLLKKDAIVPVADKERGYISTIFLREKKDNKYRLILNLKNFNGHVTYRRFKTEDSSDHG